MNKKAWEKAEGETRNILGLHEANLQPGSGNKWNRRADIITKYDVVSVKHTNKESVSIKISDITEIEKIALEYNKDWVLVSWLDEKPYATIPLEEYQYLRTLVEEND